MPILYRRVSIYDTVYDSAAFRPCPRVQSMTKNNVSLLLPLAEEVSDTGGQHTRQVSRGLYESLICHNPTPSRSIFDGHVPRSTFAYKELLNYPKDRRSMSSWVEELSKVPNHNDILAWYSEAKELASNPYFYLGIDEKKQLPLKYVISGVISTLDGNVPKQLEIIEQLRTFLLKTQTDETHQDTELILFDLIVEANKGDPQLKFTTPFLPTQREGGTYDKTKYDACLTAGSPVKTPYVEYLPDFSSHIDPDIFKLLQLHNFFGVNSDRYKASQFIAALARNGLSSSWMEELNQFEDIMDEKAFDIEAHYNYSIRICKTWMMLLLAAIDSLLDPKIRDEEDITAKTQLLLDFTFLMVNNNLYRYMNRKGDVPPPTLFFDFRTYMTRLKANSTTLLHTLKWFYTKLQTILTYSETIEIKTAECFYDLFDSISLDQNVSKTGELIGKDSYPLRTIQFRSDFIIAPDTLVIEGVRIPKSFWQTLDETVCWKHADKPLSKFLGLLKEADRIEPLYQALKWELEATVSVGTGKRV